MNEPTLEQIRNFRLRSHHLDMDYRNEDIAELAGACGMQNSPPGAWETAVHNRVPGCSPADLKRLLCEERSLLQAWSFRGAPVVFPTSESGVFLSALIPERDEPWIYTQGITLVLDFLQMSFEELFKIFVQVMPRLSGQVLKSKSTLDQTVADWMLPLLPEEKRALWNRPSMYGSPDKQTAGGAAVSFMLRPASFSGLAVFGERDGMSPSFTSYESWTGGPLIPGADDQKKLVRKFLHCYGPATPDSFVKWLGCSGKQGRRLWKSISGEMEPVTVFGKKAFILSEDKESLFTPAALSSPEKELFLLGGHDPFLDQRDRAVLQPDQSLQKQIWKLVANPGAVLYRGEVIGIWNSKKKSGGMDIAVTLWKEARGKRKLSDLAEAYAAFCGQKLLSLEL